MNRLPLVIALLLSAPLCAVAAKARTSCPPGRFLVEQMLPETAGGAGSTARAVVLNGPGVSLDPACMTSARGHFLPRASFTAVQARWKSCSDGPGPVILRAHILGPDCNTMVGRLLARRARPVTRRIRARRSFCGDGIVDVGGGESCDGSTWAASPPSTD
jgi:hypothetical protein